jgi:hypothetical protein
LQFFAADLQFFTWVKKKARVCMPFSGDRSRLGPPKPWARTIPEPYEFHLAFYFFSALALPACKDDANHPKVSTNIT